MRKLGIYLLQVLLVGIFLVLLYVGSYLALVVPDSENSWNTIQARGRPVPQLPRYRFGGDWLKQLFWPIEQLDRQLRPQAWQRDRSYQPSSLELGDWP